MPCAAPNKPVCRRPRWRAPPTTEARAPRRWRPLQLDRPQSGRTAGAGRRVPFSRRDGFAADRCRSPARSSHGRVPHAAHPAEPHEEPAADPYGGGDQPVAGRRQIALRGESGAGAGALGGQPDTALRFRFPPADHAQPVADRPQPRHHRLSARARCRCTRLFASSPAPICTSCPPARR